MTRRTRAGIAAAFGAAGVLGVLHFTDAAAVLQVVVDIAALALLAWNVRSRSRASAAAFVAEWFVAAIDPALWQITGDGKASFYEGFALVSLYAISATAC